jgi:hypothetical protein
LIFDRIKWIYRIMGGIGLIETGHLFAPSARISAWMILPYPPNIDNPFRTPFLIISY